MLAWACSCSAADGVCGASKRTRLSSANRNGCGLGLVGADVVGDFQQGIVGSRCAVHDFRLGLGHGSGDGCSDSDTSLSADQVLSVTPAPAASLIREATEGSAAMAASAAAMSSFHQAHIGADLSYQCVQVVLQECHVVFSYAF